MSISPQSLAKTRDKRSLRMPSRFHDFREIPTEVAYREVAEALNSNDPKRVLSIEELLEPQISDMPTKATKTPTARRSRGRPPLSSKRRKSRPQIEGSTSAETGENSNSNGSSKDNSKTATPDPKDDPCNITKDQDAVHSRSSDSTGSTIANVSLNDLTTLSTAMSTTDAEPVTKTPEHVVLLRERHSLASGGSRVGLSSTTQVGSSIPDTKSTKSRIADYSRNASSRSKSQADGAKEEDDSSKIAPDNLDIDHNTAPSSSKLQDSSQNSGPDGEIVKVWKAKFHPQVILKRHKSATSRSPSKRPLAQSPIKNNKSAASPSKYERITIASDGVINRRRVSPTSSARKKSKGLSLIAKQPPNPKNPVAQQQQQTQQQQPQPTPLPFIRASETKSLTPQNPTLNSQSKQFTTLDAPTNMPHGTTRLILNEPILLPRGVGPIAPITATLQQIATRARQAPFLTKKYQAYLKYQRDLQLRHMTSLHGALIKITEHLGFKDRLNLRCVSKEWKSIVDSDAAWQKLTLKSDDSHIGLERIAEIVQYRTRDLTFDSFGLPIGKESQLKPLQFSDLFHNFFNRLEKLERVSIISRSPMENAVAKTIVEGAAQSIRGKTQRRRGSFRWNVRVGIDPQGSASITLATCPSATYSSEVPKPEDVEEAFWDIEAKLAKLFADNKGTKGEGMKFSRILMKPI